jgi:hypothetical protein
MNEVDDDNNNALMIIMMEVVELLGWDGIDVQTK